MFELKPISEEAIPAALAKAERYRLLNEPRETESICRDVLRADPSIQSALVMMLLAITDQFGKGFEVDINEARVVLTQLRDPYDRAYYAGVICERWAKSLLVKGYAAYDWFREAMAWFEKAEPLAAPGNDDAVLRWNACARTIMRHEQVSSKTEGLSPHADVRDEEEVPRL